METGRVLFLAGAFATHSVVGYALVSAFTDADPRIGLVFGLLPDADFLFPADWAWPFVHRGITHTPLFALAAVAVGYTVGRHWTPTIGRRLALAVGLALGSHLVIDSLSPKGIDPLFPLRTSWSPGLAVHSPTATALLWTASISLLAWSATEISSVR